MVLYLSAQQAFGREKRICPQHDELITFLIQMKSLWIAQGKTNFEVLQLSCFAATPGGSSASKLVEFYPPYFRYGGISST